MLQVRVAAKKVEAQDICSFELVAALPGQELPAFGPGAHIDVHIPGGAIRQYSLWNSPADTGVYRIGVLREANGRGGSVGMHDTVQEGSTLQIGLPRNHFPLSSSGKHSLLLAGGIGITPILCMAQSLVEAGRSFELHYCSRSHARTAFMNRLHALGQRCRLYVDEDPVGERFRIGEVLSAQPAETHLYTCGPKGFMDAVLQAARGMDWNEDRLHYEFFQTETIPVEGDTAFDVQLMRSGRTVRVGHAQTVAHALMSAGVDLQTSCEQGICGTCVTRVLAGIPDHRDSFLMPEEQAANDCFTPCCSRSLSPTLVLDL
ncbi:PDR/VanB family oxidoreductase [Ottowia thiooxydans]|uniref:PDR/VanB family oxidoreductase n=1 Tax=Ottowia thiooxydans TaxID=219182 RepID=UPI003394D722